MENIKVGISPLSYEGNNHRYTAHVIRVNNQELEGIEGMKISLPTSSSEITSMKATFTLSDNILIDGERLTIKVCDDVGNAIYSLSGKSEISNITHNYTGTKSVSVTVYDEFEKLFEKVVAKDTFYFDQWLYNSLQKENSILYKIAKELGFSDENMDFEDIRDAGSELIKIPLMIIREGSKWVDELHTLADCSKGMLYIEQGKLVFRSGLFKYAGGEIHEFNDTNILRSLKEEIQHTEYNGVKLTYDSYKYLDNQVIFDISEKIEVAPNTTTTEKEFNITYVTDIVSQHNLTSAKGYYYTSEAVESKVDVDLIAGTHYEFTEFKESKAKVKFYNPYPHKLYINKFEIKGIPIAKYEDNIAVAKDEDILEENQENFKEADKNKYIQTEALAKNMVTLSYRELKKKRTFSFTANFLPGYQLGKVYGLVLGDIITKITIDSIEVDLSRTKGFTLSIQASELSEEDFKYKVSLTENLISDNKYLTDLKNKIEDTKEEQAEIIKAMGACGYVDENDPQLSKTIKEPDVWFNPSTKQFKVWRNNQWNPAREEDIPPALMTALKAQAGYLQIGGNDVKAGIFFSYDNDPNNPVFGSCDTEQLAEISIDKKANVLMRNANNKLAFNMRDPENPSLITSQLLMGVYNADDEKHKDTLFQIGDESTGTCIKLTREGIKQTVGGKPIEEAIQEGGGKEVAEKLAKGQFTITADTQVNGMLEVYGGDNGITSYSADKKKKIIIKGGEIEFWEDV